MDNVPGIKKSDERNAFLFITIVLFPLLSVIIVGGLGLSIWIYQMIYGPPAY